MAIFDLLIHCSREKQCFLERCYVNMLKLSSKSLRQDYDGHLDVYSIVGTLLAAEICLIGHINCRKTRDSS